MALTSAVLVACLGNLSFAEPAPLLSAERLEGIWADFILLDDEGTKTAHEGIRTLIGIPKSSVPFLGERLKPVPGPDARRLQLLIADLESGDFRTREEATRALEKLGPLAAPALEKKLTEKQGLEMRRRLEMLVERADHTVLTLDELRAVRAIDVLQGIGSADAVAVLEKLAGGADGAVQTVRARQALRVLRRAR